MTRLLALLFALFVPQAAGRHSRPDAWATAVFDGIGQALASLRAHAHDAVSVVRGWAAMAVDPMSPLPGTAPLLAARIGAAAPTPPTVERLLAAARVAGRRLVDDAESRFIHR